MDVLMYNFRPAIPWSGNLTPDHNYPLPKALWIFHLPHSNNVFFHLNALELVAAVHTQCYLSDTTDFPANSSWNSASANFWIYPQFICKGHCENTLTIKHYMNFLLEESSYCTLHINYTALANHLSHLTQFSLRAMSAPMLSDYKTVSVVWNPSTKLELEIQNDNN